MQLWKLQSRCREGRDSKHEVMYRILTDLQWMINHRLECGSHGRISVMVTRTLWGETPTRGIHRNRPASSIDVIPMNDSTYIAVELLEKDINFYNVIHEDSIEYRP